MTSTYRLTTASEWKVEVTCEGSPLSSNRPVSTSHEITTVAILDGHPLDLSPRGPFNLGEYLRDLDPSVPVGQRGVDAATLMAKAGMKRLSEDDSEVHLYGDRVLESWNAYMLTLDVPQWDAPVGSSPSEDLTRVVYNPTCPICGFRRSMKAERLTVVVEHLCEVGESAVSFPFLSRIYDMLTT